MATARFNVATPIENSENARKYSKFGAAADWPICKNSLAY